MGDIKLKVLLHDLKHALMTGRLSLTRRRFNRAGLLSAAMLAVPLTWAQRQGARERLVLALSNKAVLQHLPVVLAEQLGYFRAEGLQLEISDLQDDARTRSALLDGSVDVAVLPFDETIQQQERQAWRPQWLQSIVLLGRAPQMALGLAQRHLDHFQATRSWRGKRIGMALADVYPQRLVQLFLERVGIRSDEVQWVGVTSTADALMALRREQIDAVSISDPAMTMLEHRGEVRVIADTRTLSGAREVFGGPVPGACLCVSHAFARKQAQSCQALANGIVHALKWLQTAGASDILKTVPEPLMLSDRALYLAAFNNVREAYSPDGLVSTEGPSNLLKALSRLDARTPTGRIDLSQTYTNQFAQRAKDRFKA